MAEATAPRPQWLDTMIGKVVGITALFAAAAGLVNGALDLYRAVAKVPTNIYEETNDELFKRHFNEPPVFSQPVSVKNGNVTVEMMLHVYKTGDVFVRYGEFQQWIPFKAPTMNTASAKAFSLIPEAQAQESRRAVPALPETAAAAPLLRKSIVIDIDSLKAGKIRSLAVEPDGILEKSFLLAKMKEDHDSFTSSTAGYSEVYRAEPGYRIVEYDFQLGSANEYKLNKIELLDQGKALRVDFSLTSGPFYDRYRGWLQATIKTRQKKIQ